MPYLGTRLPVMRMQRAGLQYKCVVDRHGQKVHLIVMLMRHAKRIYTKASFSPIPLQVAQMPISPKKAGDFRAANDNRHIINGSLYPLQRCAG